MRYLLDTCVLSETIKPQPTVSVLTWLDEVDESDLFLSVLTLGEIQKGISGLPDSRRQRQLQYWLDNDLNARFSGRLLPVNGHTATDWGVLSGTARRNGHTTPAIDGLLAATARQHDLTLVTRNTADFERLGVAMINPWVE